MVADPPEKHLCSDALVDAIQQLLHETGAGFRRQEFQRRSPAKLTLGCPEPTPRALALPEDFAGECSDACDANHSVGFVTTQRLAASSSMGECAPGNHESIGLVIRQTGSAQSVDGLDGEALLDQFQKLVIVPQPMNAEYLAQGVRVTWPICDRNIHIGGSCHNALLERLGNMPTILWQFATTINAWKKL